MKPLQRGGARSAQLARASGATGVMIGVMGGSRGGCNREKDVML